MHGVCSDMCTRSLWNTAAATAEPILYRMARYFVRLLKLWHLVEVTLTDWTYML